MWNNREKNIMEKGFDMRQTYKRYASFVFIGLSAVAILTALTGLVSCTSDDSEMTKEHSGRPIMLRAMIEDDAYGTGTRSPYIGSSPTRDNPLSVAVWSSTTPGDYAGSQSEPPVEGSTVIDYHNTTNFFSGSISQLLDKRLFYPSDNTPVYFVAFCPNSQAGWSMPDNHSAKHQFTGCEDVMYASQASSCYSDKREPLLRFRHQLTWLRIKVRAEEEDASRAWGRIKSISVVSDNTITIDASIAEGVASTFSSEGDALLPTYITGLNGNYSDARFDADAFASYETEKEKLPDARSMTLFPGLSWEEVVKTFGEIPWEEGVWRDQCYVLCAPVQAHSANGTNEYQLLISTEKRNKVMVPVSLRAADDTEFEGYTQGHQFNIELTFRLGDKISTVGTVEKWVNGGLGQNSLGDE